MTLLAYKYLSLQIASKSKWMLEEHTTSTLKLGPITQANRKR